MPLISINWRKALTCCAAILCLAASAQARETVNPFYAKVPEIVQAAMDKFAGVAGRRYNLYVYFGSRTAIPARVRCFIDLAVEQLSDSCDFVLSAEELANASQIV